MIPPVPVTRYFSLLPESEEEFDERGYQSLRISDKRICWADLEAKYRCVILAEAGAGKTFEMETRAKHINQSGRSAFFIRIEDINEDFENAFEVGCVDSFEDWLSSSDEAWFFLDAVDEARLNHPSDFDKAVKRFASRIKPALQRAHILISARPYTWQTHADRDLINRHLPLATSGHHHAFRAEFVDDISQKPNVQSPGQLPVYLLAPLDEAGIRFFAEHLNTPQVNRLIGELDSAGLMQLASRPLDLYAILASWQKSFQLGGRFNSLTDHIERLLSESDATRERRQPLHLEKAMAGAQLLAAAVILTGEPGIRVPGSYNTRGVDAQVVLGSDWQHHDVQALLERGIFNDAIFGAVRFRHREIRELLAAQWFSGQLKTGNSRRHITSLFIRKQYDQTVITPRLRPVLTWLIHLDPELRQEVLRIAPELIVEGGDASRLTLGERKTLLYNIVNRIASDIDMRSVRNNEAIMRIAQPDLSEDILKLLQAHHADKDITFFLARLACQGRMTACVTAFAGIAVNPAQDIYSRTAAVRAVMTSGVLSQKANLWNALNLLDEPVLPVLFTELLSNAEPDIALVEALLVSIVKLENKTSFPLEHKGLALHDFITRLAEETSAAKILLPTLVTGLHHYVRSRLKRRDHLVSQQQGWILSPAMHAAEELIAARSDLALSPETLQLLLNLSVTRFGQDPTQKKYEEALRRRVSGFHELNDALFWLNVKLVRADTAGQLTQIFPLLMSERLWDFGEKRFADALEYVATKELLDDKRVALSLAHFIYSRTDKSETSLNKLKLAAQSHPELESSLKDLLSASPSEERAEKSALELEYQAELESENLTRKQLYQEWVLRLKSHPDRVLHPKDVMPGEISSDQHELMVQLEANDATTGRMYGSRWKALIPTFGEEVATAYRDAAVAFWRTYRPGLRSEGDSSSYVPYKLLFALAGLNIESVENPNFTAGMNKTEVHHVMRYVTREMEGLPRWLRPVFDRHPDWVLEAISAELFWELQNTPAGHEGYYIAHRLGYFGRWMHEHLKPVLFPWMSQHEVLNADLLLYCIQMLMSGTPDITLVSQLAQAKLAPTVVTPHAAIWYALWVDVDAASAVPAFTQWLSLLPVAEASNQAEIFIVHLLGLTRTEKGIFGCGDYENVQHLKQLYKLMHQYIRAEDDIDRINTGTYMPTRRDDAQDGRGELLNRLTAIPGKETFIALTELAQEHPHSGARQRMVKLAFKVAEEDGDLEAWSSRQMRDFVKNQSSLPVTHRQLFDLAVLRLNDLKDALEYGNNSPYQTWRRADKETEMRILVANWLNDRSNNYYTCAQENELANQQRTDITLDSPQVKTSVPVELKLLDKGWTGPELCERLSNQLAGDYLREVEGGCGVMLLIYQDRNVQTHWKIGNNLVALSGLADAMKIYWESISSQFPRVSAIEVIVIDLNLRALKSAV